jgi:hypothetical protein
MGCCLCVEVDPLSSRHDIDIQYVQDPKKEEHEHRPPPPSQETEKEPEPEPEPQFLPSQAEEDRESKDSGSPSPRSEQDDFKKEEKPPVADVSLAGVSVQVDDGDEYTIELPSQTEPVTDNFTFEALPTKPPTVPIYRYCSPRTSDHLYTANASEIGTTQEGAMGKHGYKSEGIAFYLAESEGVGLVPVYRYWGNNDHLYTTNVNEIGTTQEGVVGNHGYKCEGVLGYISETKTDDTVPVYRFYKPQDHFYTTNSDEIGISEVGAKHNGWSLESILGYAWSN